MKQPVIFVSANYRLNFFGTLASKEITKAGVANLFLKDQDVAFEWVQKYVSQFGGDPDKVTVFGESAGAMSTTTHMVLNNGNVTGKFNAVRLTLHFSCFFDCQFSFTKKENHQTLLLMDFPGMDLLWTRPQGTRLHSRSTSIRPSHGSYWMRFRGG